MFGSRLDLRRRDDAAACDVIAVLPAKRLAASVLQQEHQRRLGIHVDLGVIAGVDQFLVAIEKPLLELRFRGDGIVQERRGQAADGLGQRVDVQHPMVAQDRGDQAAEGLPQGRARRVRFVGQFHHFVGEGQAVQRRDESALQSKAPSTIPPTGWLLSGDALRIRGATADGRWL